MKKLENLWLAVVAAAFLLCACGTGNSQEKTKVKESPIEDFAYEMTDGEVIITGYHGSDREISIPAKINDRPVTQISEFAFENYDMVKIVIPDSVKIIDEYAFTDCDCLTEVTIPEGVERIENYAFYECAELSQVSLPDSLTYLGFNSFGLCENLKELVIPEKFSGFEIIYKRLATTVDGMSMLLEGDTIMSPTGSSDTVFVVSPNSEALRLICQYGWYYEMDMKYEIR